MAEYNSQEDVNLFQAETSAKTVEKKMNVNIAQISSSGSSVDTFIEGETEEATANIQTEAAKTVAKSLESMTVNLENAKLSNPEIEAQLSNINIETSSGIGDRVSLAECQLAAYSAKQMSEEARQFVAACPDLIETITTTIEVLQSHVDAFATKAFEATEHESNHGYNVGDYYHTMISKYESTISVLEKRSRNMLIALNRVEESAHECLRYARLSEKIMDETLDVAGLIRSARWWTNEVKAWIIVALKKERAALLMMRRIWINVRDDMEYEEKRANPASEEDSDGSTAQCPNRDQMTTIGHIASTILGISLLSISKLFKSGTDSYNAILALGIIIIGWCSMYWSYKLYKCLKENDEEQQAILARRTATVERMEQRKNREESSFLENCNRKLELVKDNLLKYDIILESDEESDTGSLETVAIGDIEQ